MAQTAFSIRMDDGLKRDFSQFCENIGMTMSTAFVVFAKATLRARRIPFEIYDYRDPESLERAQSRERARRAFESMRAEIQERYKDQPEPTLDEINAEIARVRKERCERLARERDKAGVNEYQGRH